MTLEIRYEPEGLREGRSPRPWAVIEAGPDSPVYLAWMESRADAELVRDFLEDLAQGGVWRQLREWIQALPQLDDPKGAAAARS